MQGRWLIAAILLGAGSAAAAPPAPAVLVAPVKLQDVAPAYSFIGHVQAIQSVQIVPRVTAFIAEEPVPQGSVVKAGEIIFRLQQDQYQAALQAAQAQLQSAQAALHAAELAFQRAQQLNKQGVEAQSNLEQATATRDQDQANVLAAKANLAQAALNLSYCTITSPIDGRIGVISLTKGNLVTPSTPPLTTINQMDPIRVVFSVADRDLVDVQQKSGASPTSIAATLAVRLTLSNGTAYGQGDEINFLDNQVDPRTGTVSVYATFPNPDGLLLPGSFVNVTIRRANRSSARWCRWRRCRPSRTEASCCWSAPATRWCSNR